VRRAAALGALSLALLAACGGGGSKTVAHVGDDAVTQKQLDAVVAHFRTEAQREGKPFPEEGTKTYDRTRNQLLQVLVYRTELQQAAKRLGVKADESEIAKRLASTPGGENEGTSGDTFARDSVETQLLLEGIFAKVTRGVTGKNPADKAARRNRAMTGFLGRLRRETKVRYEPGYAPGS
jgi:hypothetical protein